MKLDLTMGIQEVEIDIGQIPNLSEHLNQNYEDKENFEKTYPPKQSITDHAYIKSLKEYKSMYEESIRNPDKFWAQIALEFYFKETHTQIPMHKHNNGIFKYNFDISSGPISTTFMEGKLTNVCYNVLDRHILNGSGDRRAIIWEGNSPLDNSILTYNELFDRVNAFANGLLRLGVNVGDVVAIYMPMVVEVVVAMLACVRIGAVHSVIFAGYSAQAIADRLVNGKVKVLITADASWRGEKLMKLKEICDDAVEKAKIVGHCVKYCIVLNHISRTTTSPNELDNFIYTAPAKPIDLSWDQVCSDVPDYCPPIWVDSEHPMFILYTSGSNGKPKGVVHSTGGYLIFSSTVFKYSFDFHPESQDVFWCTSDMGWCSAHTNGLYGPLSLGGTTVIFEGIPFYPTITRAWEIIEKYNVTHFYTAPTVLRHFKQFGNLPLKKFSRNSLRVLGTVGEPISPDVWNWYYNTVGKSRCPIIDTYGQTETGGHLLTLIPGIPAKPSSVGLPFFGASPVLLDKEGKIIEGPGEGILTFSKPWPCIARSVFGNKDLYERNYFSQFPGYYCTGDAARRDEDGYYYVTGRADDMVNVSGHLINLRAVESIIMKQKDVTQAVVVPVPHPIKGHCLYSFLMLSPTIKTKNRNSSQITKEVHDLIRSKIGSLALPEKLIYTPVLPMTRTGKILRRILTTIAKGGNDFGDISTLDDDSVLNVLKSLKFT